MPDIGGTPRGPDSASRRSDRALRAAAVALLALCAFLGSLTLVWNFDIFAHLACGRWMVQHMQVLGHDPFTSAPDNPDATWVNVHWGFQLLVTGVHALAGFAGLSVLKAAFAAGMMLVFALALRRHIPVAWLIVSGLLTYLVAIERIRVRPEIVTLLLMTVFVVVLEQVRSGAPRRRLWLLPVLMLPWVNMHGLFVLGLGLMWAAVAGAAFDRWRKRDPLDGALTRPGALLPIAAASLVPLLTPWPLHTFSLPLLLWTRISGEAAYYSYGVTELGPLVRDSFVQTMQEVSRYPTAIVLVLAGLGAMLAHAYLSRGRRGESNASRPAPAIPAHHVLWAGALLLLALLARRNVGMIAPVFGWLLAWHGGRALGGAGIRSVPGPSRIATLSAITGLLLAVAGAGLLATEWVHRWRESFERFGVGLQTDNYPLDIAHFLRDLPGEGDILCENFGDASVFLYVNPPQRKTWMDGRLEAHSAERFRRQHEYALALRSAATAERAKLPPTVRFIVVRYWNHATLEALARSPRFRLLKVGIAGACFERTDWRGERGGGTMAPPDMGPPLLGPLAPVGSAVETFDRPLADGAWSLENLRPVRRRWWRANAQSFYQRIGNMMLSLSAPLADSPGTADPGELRLGAMAVRYLTAAEREGVAARHETLGLLAEANRQRSVAVQASGGEVLPVDVHMARSLHLLRLVDLAAVPATKRWIYGLQHIQGLVQVGAFDAAERVLEDLRSVLPPGQRVNPPTEYVRLRDVILDRLGRAELTLSRQDLPAMAAVERATAMAGRGVGQVLGALTELDASGADTPDATRLRCDLLLRLGRPREARELALGMLDGPEGQGFALRVALADWALGDLHTARERLQATAAATNPDPLACLYGGLLLEELGRYDQAATLADAGLRTVEDKPLRDALARLRDRLPVR